MMLFTSSCSNALCHITRSTLNILPRIGRIAWKCRSRPCFAEPPAESPSTMNISQFAASLSEQSANLPGRPPPVIGFLRCTLSRALRAATRAVAASTTLSTMSFASFGCSSRYALRASPTACCTAPATSLLPNFVLVCPSNCGSATFTEITAVRPSRKSSPEISMWFFSSFSVILLSSAYFFSTRVSAVRKPCRCVPPSIVLILFT